MSVTILSVAEIRKSSSIPDVMVPWHIRYSESAVVGPPTASSTWVQTDFSMPTGERIGPIGE